MDTILNVEGLNKEFTIGRRKKTVSFQLKDINFELPKGFNVALIGSNGAGKTTLLDLIMGFQKSDGGEITYFGNERSIESNNLKNRIGYVSDDCYFFSQWTVKQIAKAMDLGFDNFNETKFEELVKQFNIIKKIPVMAMSKGAKMRLMIAAQLARDTELLILDEPASPLDPVMRDELCDIFSNYIKDGKRTVFFSTHNIADMEHVTDYVIIMKNGQIIEKGFVEDLKEKYVVVRGNSQDISNITHYIKNVRLSITGFEGIIRSEYLERINTLHDIAYENPSLQQIAVMLLKEGENYD